MPPALSAATRWPVALVMPPSYRHAPPACPLLQNEADAYRNIKLRVEDVQGRNCLTQFHVSGPSRQPWSPLGQPWSRLGQHGSSRSKSRSRGGSGAAAAVWSVSGRWRLE